LDFQKSKIPDFQNFIVRRYETHLDTEF